MHIRIPSRELRNMNWGKPFDTPIKLGWDCYKRKNDSDGICFVHRPTNTARLVGGYTEIYSALLPGYNFDRENVGNMTAHDKSTGDR